MTTHSLFPTAHWAAKQPDGVAVRWKRDRLPYLAFLPDQISWQQWHQLVVQAGAMLQQRGIRQGELVAYLGSHRLLGLLCYCATLAIGARLVMPNPAMTEPQRVALWAQLRVAHFIGEQDFAQSCFFSPPCESVLGEWASLDFAAPATLTLTSGSSGQPKAVVHSLNNHLDNARGVCQLMGFTASHSWLLSLPLFHVSGQGIVWRWLSVGATLVVCEDKANFYSSLSQVSHASLVPTQLQRYLATALPLQGEQHILLGGAGIPPHLVEQAQQRNIVPYCGYGLTEMASTVCAVKNQTDNVGTPLAGREVRLEQGEIWVRGAGLGLGYWQQGNLVPLTNAQGWFATKDNGEWHQHQLRILGRKDNQFISGGENIQPEQIERVLMQSGLLHQVMVVPIDDAEFGQRPVAVVDFVNGWHDQSVRSLRQFATAHLEKFKHPVYYVCWSSVAISSGIKVARHALMRAVAARFMMTDLKMESK